MGLQVRKVERVRKDLLEREDLVEAMVQQDQKELQELRELREPMDLMELTDQTALMARTDIQV